MAACPWLIELIVCDLVLLRKCSTYLGIVLSIAALGAIARLIVGGALVDCSRYLVAMFSWASVNANSPLL
jgi:hypothetical protein